MDSASVRHSGQNLVGSMSVVVYLWFYVAERSCMCQHEIGGALGANEIRLTARHVVGW